MKDHIYINQGNSHWDNDISWYIQFGDIFFFRHETNNWLLFFDYLTNQLLETDFTEIVSIKFLTKKNLEINGKIYNPDKNSRKDYDFSNDHIEKTTVINLDNNRMTEEGIIGKVFNEPEKGKIDYNGETYSIFEKINGLESIRYSNIFLYNLFEKNILFNLDDIIPRYSYANILVIYNKTHNMYFICVNNLGRLE